MAMRSRSSWSACGFGKVAEGTIYPLLLRLEKNGLVLRDLPPVGGGAEAQILRADRTPAPRSCCTFVQNYAELTRAVSQPAAETWIKEEHSMKPKTRRLLKENNALDAQSEPGGPAP